MNYLNLDKAMLYGKEKIGIRDTRYILSHITGYTTGGLMLKFNEELTPVEYNLFLEYVRRRQANEPLQYILGQWDFMGLTLLTDKRALIPRPETELLVEEALDYITNIQHAPVRVLDVCTGSGCIALAIALLAENAIVTATDISEDALELARENAEKLKISPERVKFLKSDLLEGISENPLSDEISGEFDIIVSNPPYILSGDMPGLSPAVRDHEPHLALDGGTDGLDFYRRLIPQCKKILRDGGALFLEIGSPAVVDLMADAGFENITKRHDFAELERIVSGIKI